ncbi:MAG: hypothetical protein ACT4P7_11790 [Gemmatimonadaceae bacterium]
MTHPAPTFAEIAHIVVAHTDPLTLGRMRRIDHACNRLANNRLATLFQGLIHRHREQLGFPDSGFAIHDGVLYRGDTRPPSQVFGLGFGKRNLDTPFIDGEKVKNVISTSKDPGVVRRKYAGPGGYLYALAGARGLDTHNFNKLEEVATLFVPPECIIAAIGPVVGEDEERYQLIVGVHEAHMNPNCNRPVEQIAAAREVLLGLCHA